MLVILLNILRIKIIQERGIPVFNQPGFNGIIIDQPFSYVKVTGSMIIHHYLYKHLDEPIPTTIPINQSNLYNPSIYKPIPIRIPE